MSQAKDVNELAAAIVGALNERNADALLALLHPNYEFHSRLVAVEGRSTGAGKGFSITFATSTKASRMFAGIWRR